MLEFASWGIGRVEGRETISFATDCFAITCLCYMYFESDSSSFRRSRDEPKIGKTRIRYDKNTTPRLPEVFCKTMVCGAFEECFAVD